MLKAIYPNNSYWMWGLRPFRPGAFKVAVSSGAPVVPIAVRGPHQVDHERPLW